MKDCPKCGSTNLIVNVPCQYCGYIDGGHLERADIFPFNHLELVDCNEDRTVGVIRRPGGHFCGYILLHESIFPKDIIKLQRIKYEKMLSDLKALKEKIRPDILFEQFLERMLETIGDDLIDYDIFNAMYDPDVHGGFTYAKRVPPYIILGWDYAHVSSPETSQAYVKNEGIRAIKKIIKQISNRDIKEFDPYEEGRYGKGGPGTHDYNSFGN